MKSTRKGLPYVVAILGFAAVLAGWCAWWRFGAAWVARYWVAAPKPAEPAIPVTLTDLGQAGDLFGGFSALFSALAFVGVVVAAYLQRETIRLQRQQIEDAKADGIQSLATARDERVAADLQRARQAFEPLFFQLVNLLRQQTQMMQLTVLRGRSDDDDSMYFAAALAAIRDCIARTWSIELSPSVPSHKLEIASEYYLRIYAANESHLGPYFRTLYHALKLIHRSGLPEDEKVDYANILRGLLTRDELLLVMLNCLSGYGAGLKVFIETYGVLKHISRQEEGAAVLDKEIAAGGFAPTATMSWRERKAYWVKHPKPEPVYS